MSLDTCTCRWIHAWVPRVEAGMYYEVRSWRERPMLSSLSWVIIKIGNGQLSAITGPSNHRAEE
jgi:hypothetical protein